MLPSKLPAIHTKIAEYLEKNPDACPPPAVKHLAHHWRKAQRPEIAIGYYSQVIFPISHHEKHPSYFNARCNITSPVLPSYFLVHYHFFFPPPNSMHNSLI
jgi:hypothetical protein